MNNLKSIRDALGLSQAVLASRCDLSQAQIHWIESGQSEGRVQTLRALRNALCCTFDDLLLSPPTPQRLAEIRACYFEREAALARVEAAEAGKAVS